MNLLYITQYFYPEIGAPINRALANVRYLSNRKFQITVLTEMPNHPKGMIFDGYRYKFFISEKMENFIIKRFWVWTSKRKTSFNRILFYISFALFGSLYTLLRARKYDIIYISSPPLFVALIGLITKLCYPNKKIVFEVRDLWPDSAVQMGELNNKLFLSLSYMIENLIYSHSHKIIAVTEYIKDQIIMKGVSAQKVLIIYNGIETQQINLKIDAPISEIQEKKNSGNFIVIYAGILGLAQNLSTVIKAASILQKEKIHFFFAGTGPKEQQLMDEAKDLHNVSFLGEIPRNLIHNYLLAADCGVVPLASIPIFKGALPSKMFEYMAFGLPILLGIEGEAAKILTNSNGGIAFLPDDAVDLANKIILFCNHPEKLKQYSGNGREYVYKYFDREKQAKKLEYSLNCIQHSS